MSSMLTIALPKGKLGLEALDLLAKAGLPTDGVSDESRKLLIECEKEQVKYIICRPTDIPTYVEYGAADIGIVGKDTIEEAEKNLFELLDLGFGKCTFVLALPRSALNSMGYEGKRVEKILSHFPHLRIATKFPKVASKYLQSLGVQAEIIPLHGNIELAPLVGLSEGIVDIVSTGKTLRENDLVAVDEIFEATARVIANRVSYKLKYHRIQELIGDIRKILAEDKND
jgi:ATP phosphoribosyltransferase